jgi:hypothetical protein
MPRDGLYLDESHDVPVHEMVSDSSAGAIVLPPIAPGLAIGGTRVALDPDEQDRGVHIDLEEHVGPGVSLAPEIQDEGRAAVRVVGEEGDDGKILLRIGAALDEGRRDGRPPGLVGHVQKNPGIFVDAHPDGHVDVNFGVRRAGDEEQDHSGAEKMSSHFPPPYSNRQLGI